jgi:predicted metal-dependent hydrolase
LLITQSLLLKLLDISEKDSHLLSLRQSARAKKLFFKPSIKNGFEIVLPRFYDEKWVQETIIKNKPNIEKSMDTIKESRTELKPTSILLPLIGRSWKVVYRQFNEHDSDTTPETSTTLNVSEKPEDIFWTARVLQKWLHKKAAEHLTNHIYEVSSKLKLSFNKVRIKRQKTRWGSCSIKRNINLNRNLMLMSPNIVDYVLHHELVHLKVLNHSSTFWNELERSFPNYKNIKKQLKFFNTQIPKWALV